MTGARSPLATERWSIELPVTITARDVVRPPADTDLTAMTVCWGHLTDDAWARVVVSTRPRKGRTLRSYLREVTGSEGAEVSVAGAHGARRADVTSELEEPVRGHTVERVTVVAAAGRREYVTLTIAALPGAGEEVDAIVASLRLLDV